MSQRLAPVTAAVLGLAASLLTAVGPAAGAAADEPYPGTVGTTCRISVDKQATPRRARVTMAVAAPTSTARPVGTTRVVVRREGKVVQRRSVDTARRSTLSVRVARWRQTRRYTVRVSFVPREGTVFAGCARSRVFRTKKSK